MNHRPAPLRGAFLITIAGLTLTLAACGESDGGTPAPGATLTVENGTVELDADDLAFNASTIEAPAGEPFTVTLNNLESQPHNVSFYVEQGGERIVIGDVITGPDATITVEVPALEAGEYFFVCDIHVAERMYGTLVVEG